MCSFFSNHGFLFICVWELDQVVYVHKNSDIEGVKGMVVGAMLAALSSSTPAAQ